jgi:hypothetical protein
VGCGKTDCGNAGGKGKAWDWFLICEYYPPGNVDGAYQANVQSEVKANLAVAVKATNLWISMAAVFSMMILL